MTSKADATAAFVWMWLPEAKEPVIAGRLDQDGERLLYTYGGVRNLIGFCEARELVAFDRFLHVQAWPWPHASGSAARAGSDGGLARRRFMPDLPHPTRSVDDNGTSRLLHPSP